MYKGYLIDLDGTLYRGKERIPEAEAFVKELLVKEIPFVFVTNNATQSIGQIREKLNTYYQLPINESHIYTSTLALVDYLKANHPSDNVYAIGEEGFFSELDKAGIQRDLDSKVDVVVQALSRQVTYSEVAYAVQAILGGAEFLVTNTDRLLPTEKGWTPSAGSITSAIHYSSQVQPVVMGKPHKYIMEGALHNIGLKKEEVLMIGDNYDTDIQAGIRSGIDTLLVLSGVTQADQVPNLKIAPTHVRQSLSEWELI